MNKLQVISCIAPQHGGVITVCDNNGFAYSPLRLILCISRNSVIFVPEE